MYIIHFKLPLQDLDISFTINHMVHKVIVHKIIVILERGNLAGK